MYRFLVLALSTTTMVATGCSKDGASASAGSTPSTQTHTDSAGGLIVAPGTPYVSGRAGSAVLHIRIADAAAVPRDSGSCEVAAAPPPAADDVVVWVDGVRQGKPLTDDRRYELVSAGCTLSPRIQAVVTGGTVNVYNDDKILHTLVFIRAGTNDTLQTMPFTNDNEIVASERLARTPGVVEVRCKQHPQERAYIVVFDHPYFGVATGGSTVTMDSMPAGDYTVKMWHEGMSAPSSTPTTVGTSGQAQVVVK
jgi:hypothetical protein